jgi:hypothetical protein
MDHFDETEASRLKAALKAAQAAGNQTLVKAIKARMEGRVFDPFSDMHPEVREMIDPK